MSARAEADEVRPPAGRGLDRGNVVLLTGYLLLALLLGYLSLESPLRTPLWSLLLLGAGGISAIVLPSRPATAFAAALVLAPLSLGLGSGAECLLVLAALFRAGIEQSARRAWAALGIAAVVAVATGLLFAFRVRLGPPFLGLSPRAAFDEWPTDWMSATFIFLSALLITSLLGLNIGHRRRHIAGLVERAEQLRRERDQQASIAAALERERIAREMHDVIAHSLSVMIALADGAEAAAPLRPEESRRAIGRVAETGRRTLGEVRRLLGTVRAEEDPAQPAALGLEQLPTLVDEFRAAGLPVRMEQRGRLDAEAVVGLTVYRIVQESLTNVLRHAREVREVLVRLLLGEDEVTVVVEDVSAPAAPATSPGRGLVGIRERAAFYDGHVQAGPRAGGGWRVVVRLPVEER